MGLELSTTWCFIRHQECLLTLLLLLFTLDCNKSFNRERARGSRSRIEGALCVIGTMLRLLLSVALGVALLFLPREMRTCRTIVGADYT